MRAGTVSNSYDDAERHVQQRDSDDRPHPRTPLKDVVRAFLRRDAMQQSSQKPQGPSSKQPGRKQPPRGLCASG